MLLDGHLHIEASELAQMSVGIGILGSEDWSNFEYAIKVTAECHLLIKLWTLSEARWLIEVLEGEYVRATLRSTTDHFWGVDLNEPVLKHEFSIEPANTGLKLEDGLVSWNTQVDDTVVKSDILINNWELLSTLFLLFIFFWTTAHFLFLVSDKSAGIVDLEWENWSRFVIDPELLNNNLNFLGATSDWLFRHSYGTLNVDDRFIWNLGAVFNHTFANLVAGCQDTLDSSILLSQLNEKQIAASGSSSVKSTAELNSFTIKSLIDILDMCECSFESQFWVPLRSVEFFLAE